MVTHEPANYHCPFCKIARGEAEQETIVWRDSVSLAFLSLHQNLANPGTLLLCPIGHFENIYLLPNDIGAHMFSVSKQLAVTLKKALACDGVSIRQHNEPSGNQDVWHYHMHIAPRYAADNYFSERGVVMPIERRVFYANKISQALPSRAP
jgi:histidine triad (HIT) family protein